MNAAWWFGVFLLPTIKKRCVQTTPYANSPPNRLECGQFCSIFDVQLPLKILAFPLYSLAITSVGNQ